MLVIFLNDSIESNFYQHLRETYLLTEGQRWENKYPRRDPDDENMVLIKDYRPSDNRKSFART